MGVAGVNAVVDGGGLIGERFVGDATVREERLRESEEDVRPNCCSFGDGQSIVGNGDLHRARWEAGKERKLEEA